MSDNLKILIEAKLEEQLSEKNIKNQLDEISKKLQITLSTDTKSIANMTKQLNELQKKIKEINNSSSLKVISNDEVNNGKKVFKTVQDAVKEYRKFGDVSVFKQKLDPVTREVQEFSLEIKKSEGLVQKLKFSLANLQVGNDLTKVFEVSNLNEVSKVAALKEKQQQQEIKIREAVEKATLKEQEKTRELEHQLNLYKQQAQLKATGLVQQYKSNVDNNSLNEYLKNVDRLNVNTPNLKHEMDNLGMSFKQIQSNAKLAAGSAESFGNQLTTALSRVPVWMTAMTINF